MSTCSVPWSGMDSLSLPTAVAPVIASAATLNKSNDLKSAEVGTCGTCACKVSNPQGVELDSRIPMDEKRRDAGFILSCVALVKMEGLTVDINEEEAYLRTG